MWWRDAPDSAEKFPRKSDRFQLGAHARELHDGWTPWPWVRTAPCHAGRAPGRGASGRPALSLRRVPAPPEVLPASAALVTARLSLQILKEAHQHQWTGEGGRLPHLQVVSARSSQDRARRVRVERNKECAGSTTRPPDSKMSGKAPVAMNTMCYLHRSRQTPKFKNS